MQTAHRPDRTQLTDDKRIHCEGCGRGASSWRTLYLREAGWFCSQCLDAMADDEKVV